MRRLKQVSLSVPCVIGPYTSVGCKLSLVGNRYRKNASYTAGATKDREKYEEVKGNDPRFVYNVGPIQSIATSRGDNDAGLFEIALRDERYLPFEGAGAISDWRLELPAALPQFDYATITDVVLTLRYTARDGGSAFRQTVENALAALLTEMEIDDTRKGLFAGVALRDEMPDAWALLNQSGSTSLTMRADNLPYFARGRKLGLQTATWIARTSGDAPDLAINGKAVTFQASGSLFVGSSDPLTLDAPITLATATAANLQDLSVIIGYTLSG
jgi:hypothetical protein